MRIAIIIMNMGLSRYSIIRDISLHPNTCNDSFLITLKAGSWNKYTKKVYDVAEVNQDGNL